VQKRNLITDGSVKILTLTGPCTKWGGLLSLSGIKEMNYNQLYKNGPYTSISDDGLKMETLVGGKDCTIWIPSAKT